MPEHHHIEETYAEWIRSQPPERLTRAERMKLVEERTWEASNRDVVRRLQKMVGRRFVLTRDRRTIADEATEVTRCLGGPAPKVYPAGTRFRIRSRVRDALLGEDAFGNVIFLREDWLMLWTDWMKRDTCERSERHPHH